MRDASGNLQPRLVDAINAHVLSDPKLAGAWRLVARGVEQQQLAATELGELIEHLRAHRDFITDELGFEFLGGALRVSFLDERLNCAPDALRAELETLRREYDARSPT